MVPAKISCRKKNWEMAGVYVGSSGESGLAMNLIGDHSVTRTGSMKKLVSLYILCGPDEIEKKSNSVLT